MRVYSHGNLWTEIKQKCGACNCEFIFKLKDVQEHIDYDFTTGSGRAYRYIVCPECGVRNIYYDPFAQTTYNDIIERSTEPPSPSGVIYDGGDEDRDNAIIYDSGDED